MTTIAGVVYTCGLCKKPLVLIHPEEMPIRRRMMTEAFGHPPACNDETGHAHVRCATQSCAALSPPGWCLCVRQSSEEIKLSAFGETL